MVRQFRNPVMVSLSNHAARRGNNHVQRAEAVAVRTMHCRGGLTESKATP